MIYLDNAATSYLKPVCVQQAVLNAMRTMSSPGRGAYAPAMQAAEMIFDCRCIAADLFGVENAENVVFTSNASHSLNIAVNSLATQGCKVLVSGFEHNSVIRPLRALGAKLEIAGRKLFNKNDVLNDFSDKIKYSDFVICTHVSNVFGYILPIYDISKICMQYNKPLIIDASQSAGVLEINSKELNAAFIAMPGHKGLMGLQGTGILICNHDTTPFIHGGSGSDSKNQFMPDYLPDRLEAGTHNVPGIAALKAGIEFINQKGLHDIKKYELNLLTEMINQLKNTKFELFYGEDQLGVLSLRHPAMDCESIAEILAENNICVRAGMHCAPLAHKSADTLDSGTVRFSFSLFNTLEEIINVCELLKSLDTQII